MSTFETARRWTTTGTAETVVMPRRHVLAIAILMCVPLPLFSLAAMVVPLPQIVARAAASFISIAAPTLDDGAVIREKATAARPVEITYRPSERVESPALSTPSTHAGSSTSTRGVPARRGVVVQAHTGGTLGKPGKPDGGVSDGSGKKTPPGTEEDPGSVDTPIGGGPPTGGQPGPDRSPEPPSSSPPNPGGGGTGGGGTGGGGGGTGGGPTGGGATGSAGTGGGGTGGGPTGGSATAGGGSGGGPQDPTSGATAPGQGGSTPPGGGNGDPSPPDTGGGTGKSSPPEPPPTASGGGGSDNGHGKP